jgi:cell wall-associated NlpC family hydrolase
MAKRIILGAVLTMALAFSSSAFAVPAKNDKKKNTPTKTQSKVAKSKTSKTSGKKKSYSRKRRSNPEVEAPVRGDLAHISPSDYRAASRSSGVSETPPLMKVTPQRDGRFLLEPLSPKKNVGPVSKPSSQLSTPSHEAAAALEQRYNRFEPWNFSDLVLTQAKHYKDTPYSRGGNLTTGYATDCSGFVQYIYKNFKIDLPRSSAEQAQVGKVVARQMDFSKLLPGDLLFFSRGGRYIGHAGIYLGEGKMIHASNRRNGVTVTDLRQPYYEGTFVVAKRVFEVSYNKQ